MPSTAKPPAMTAASARRASARRASARLDDPRVGRSVRNWVYSGVGVLLVGIGAVGVFVPGLPTTIFLIIASWLFTKSSPRLEKRLIRNRFFGPYLAYLDGNAPIPRRAKVTAISLMWVSVGISVLLLMETAAGVWLPLAVWGLALAGTAVIIRHGKRFELRADD